MHRTTFSGMPRKLYMAPHYSAALSRAIDHCAVVIAHTDEYDMWVSDEFRAAIVKLVVLGVKFIGAIDDVEELPTTQVESHVTLLEGITAYLSAFTPAQLLALFPVAKIYDGVRWETRDYFSAIEDLSTYDYDTPLDDRVDHFLMDLLNDDVFDFQMKKLLLYSELQRRRGLPTVGEMLAEKMGVKTYRMHTYSTTGKQFMLDSETGRTVRVHKQRPRHLRLLN